MVLFKRSVGHLNYHDPKVAILTNIDMLYICIFKWTHHINNVMQLFFRYDFRTLSIHVRDGGRAISITSEEI